MLRLGELELIEFNDTQTKLLAKKLSKKQKFRDFKRIDRSGKHVVFRVGLKQSCANIAASEVRFEPFTDVEMRNQYVPGDLRVSWYQAVCSEPVYFLGQQVEPVEQENAQKSYFEIRPWNNFSETHLKVERQEDKEMRQANEQSLMKKWNIWNRISDFILNKISSDEIEEVVELSIVQNNADLLARVLADKEKDLSLLKHIRFVLAKLLFCKLVVALYLYNQALYYFTEVQLTMPESMARPFGVLLSSYLLDEDNQIWLYLMFALWLAIAIQLLVTAVAWDYEQSWKVSTVCYTLSLPLLFSFAFNFATLHMSEWHPPSEPEPAAN